MTTPVEMEMTESARATRMGFMYRNVREGQTGEDGVVNVVDVAPAAVLSIGMRGDTSATAFNQAKLRLEQALATRPDLASAGPVRVMGWNDPSTPDSRKFFEVQLPVKAAEKK